MDTGSFLLDIYKPAQRLFSKCFQNRIPFHLIIIPKPVDMLFKTSIFHKLCQGILFKIRNCTGIKRKLLVKFLCQSEWQNHIADTYCRSQCFGKSIHINHFIGHINALQSRKRFSAQTQLTVIIVLNDIVMI